MMKIMKSMLAIAIILSMLSACSLEAPLGVANATKSSTAGQATPAAPNNKSNNTGTTGTRTEESGTSNPTSNDEKSLADLEYTGKQIIELNNNHAAFSKEDLSLGKGSWQALSNLDNLNRVGVANALLSKSLMPKDEREPLHVNPTGWKNKKVKVNGKTEWLYNRCHIIGFQLTGENNNPKNLMTCTRSLNDPAMLKFENEVAKYIKTSKHHIRYQVEPIFKGNELVARGVHMQGKSVENDDVDFNVFIFNIEEGVAINYEDGSSTYTSSNVKNADEGSKNGTDTSTHSDPVATIKPSNSNDQSDVTYHSCSQVRAAGKSPLRSGDPGYSRKLDGDGDGVACE